MSRQRLAATRLLMQLLEAEGDLVSLPSGGEYRDENFELGITGSGAKPPDCAVHYFSAGFDSRKSVPNGKA